MKQVFDIVESPIPGDPLAALRQQNANPWDQALYGAISHALGAQQPLNSMPAETIYDRLMAEHERATANQPFDAAAHDRAHYDAQEIASGTMVFNSLEEALEFLAGL